MTPREPALPVRPRAGRESLLETQRAQIVTPWSLLTIAAATLCGDSHAVNEDSHSPLGATGPVFVVADGVGGGAMAAWASCQLVLRLHRALDKHRVDAASLRAALLEADRDIGRGLAHRSVGPGAATVALCAGTGRLLSKWLVAWVGDCRVYRLGTTREEPPQLITRDDTYRHLGEHPPAGGSADDPARMVGNGAISAPNVSDVELRYGEALVLCSDGVHKHVEASEMGRVLREQGALDSRCKQLVELARLHGGHDDATVLVVQRAAKRRAKLLRWTAWSSSESQSRSDILGEFCS